MNRPVARFMPLVLPFLVAACEDPATGPEGEPSTVSVRAFVDANGSGVFDSGDVAVSGAQVFLVPSAGGDSLSATTDASGTAQFQDVQPGSYAAALTSPAPAGAVLASASRPVVVAAFSGGEASAEFRFVFNPGGISGVLFRDDNGNGAFDAGTDTPAPGLTVRAFQGTDTTAAAVAATTTGPAGQFSFATVRPGVYTLIFGALPTMQLVGGNAQVVTITAGQTAQANVRFTGSLVITIAEARTRNPIDSSLVAVDGTVTAGTGVFNARSFYLQDGTAGILVFGVDTAAIKPQPGARVRVVGRVAAFNNELQIVLPSVSSLGTAAVPAPRPVTGAQINAFQFQGELARSGSLRVTAVGGGATSTAYDVTVVDAVGAQFVVRVAGTGVGIPRSFWQVGTSYDVTGILNRFRTTAQLAPRSQADARAATPPVTVAAARQQAAFSSVTVDGIATVAASPTSAFGARTFYVQDATGGIMVFFNPTGSAVPVELGDSVRISGVMNAFNRELEIDSAVVTTLRTGAAVPAPRVVTGAEILARTYEGELLRANDVEVVSIPTGTGAAFNLVVRDAAGAEFQVRVAGANTGLTRASFAVGSRYDIIGILGSFNDTPQLKPRSQADVIPR